MGSRTLGKLRSKYESRVGAGSPPAKVGNDKRELPLLPSLDSEPDTRPEAGPVCAESGVPANPRRKEGRTTVGVWLILDTRIRRLYLLNVDRDRDEVD